MNIPRYERNVYFEKLVQLKAQHDPSRIIAADGWTPDVSILDKPIERVAHTVTTGRIETVRLPNGMYEARRVEVQRETDDWYGQRPA